MLPLMDAEKELSQAMEFLADIRTSLLKNGADDVPFLSDGKGSYLTVMQLEDNIRHRTQLGMAAIRAILVLRDG